METIAQTDVELDTKIQTRISAEAATWLRTEAARRSATATIGEIITELVAERTGQVSNGQWAVEILSAMADNTFGERKMVLLDAAREIAKRSK